jgi:hypothetical protein
MTRESGYDIAPVRDLSRERPNAVMDTKPVLPKVGFFCFEHMQINNLFHARRADIPVCP